MCRDLAQLRLTRLSLTWGRLPSPCCILGMSGKAGSNIKPSEWKAYFDWEIEGAKRTNIKLSEWKAYLDWEIEGADRLPILQEVNENF